MLAYRSIENVPKLIRNWQPNICHGAYENSLFSDVRAINKPRKMTIFQVLEAVGSTKNDSLFISRLFSLLQKLNQMEQINERNSFPSYQLRLRLPARELFRNRRTSQTFTEKHQRRNKTKTARTTCRKF